MKLAELTWSQAKQAITEDTLIVFPLGSIEQHGPSGPLGTDWIVPVELADRVDKEVGCVVLPALPYGICPYHMQFAGTINIGYDALYASVNNILKSMMHHGARRFLILNGHGGNSPAIERACLDVFDRGGLTAQIDWWTLAAELDPAYKGGHGDGQEVSVAQAILPGWKAPAGREQPVRVDVSDTLTANYITTVSFRGFSVKMMRAVDAVTPTGEFGVWDAAKADAAIGERMIGDCVEYIVAFAKEFVKAKLPPARKPLEL